LRVQPLSLLFVWRSYEGRAGVEKSKQWPAFRSKGIVEEPSNFKAKIFRVQNIKYQPKMAKLFHGW